MTLFWAKMAKISHFLGILGRFRVNLGPKWVVRLRPPAVRLRPHRGHTYGPNGLCVGQIGPQFGPFTRQFVLDSNINPFVTGVKVAKGINHTFLTCR